MITVSKHAKERMIQRFRLIPTDKDLKKLKEDLTKGNCHFHPTEKENRFLINVIFAGCAVSIVYDIVTETIITVMPFHRFNRINLIKQV